MDEDLRKRVFDERLQVREGKVFFCGVEIPSRNGILRFTPDISYATGSFSKLRDKHAQLQLDSVNGTQDRLNTILSRTGWPREFFKGKLILECGCGAGPDTEVLLSLGAQVVSVDIAGTDICQANIGENKNSLIVQSSIADLPFRKKSFDIVWCHRVLQHTPSPICVLDHILSYVRDDGAVFVHSYARNLKQMLSWKYALRPITRRMNPETLYRIVEKLSPPLYRFTCRLRRLQPDILGKALFFAAFHLVPVRNYRFAPQFEDKDDDYLIQYAIHDTFDCLSPRYDSPLSARNFRLVANRHLRRPFEIKEEPGMTLLRTLSANGVEREPNSV